MHLLRRESAENEEVKKLLPKLFQSMAHEKNSRFTSRFQKQISEVEDISRAGIYLGKAAAFSVSEDRFIRTIKRCIYGLHYLHLNEYLYENFSVYVYPMEVFRKISPILTYKHIKIIDAVTSNPPFEIGKNRKVFKYWFKSASDNPNSYFWILSIYEKTFYLGVVLPDKKRSINAHQNPKI